MTVADKLRAGGCGIINDFTRGDKVYTAELNLRKNDSEMNTETLLLNNTPKAMELLFAGPYISGTDPYAIDILWPVVQLSGTDAEDDATVINKTVPLDIYEDSANSAFEVFIQTEVGTAYNATN